MSKSVGVVGQGQQAQAEIKVRGLLARERASIMVVPNDTVLTLKVRIDAVLGIPHDQQRLLNAAAKTQLQDHWTLGDCGILCQAESIVYVLRLVRGGGPESLPLSTCPPPTWLPSMSLLPFQRSDGQKRSPFEGSEGQAKLCPGLNGAAIALTPRQPCLVSYPPMSEWQVQTGWEPAL